MGRGEWEEGSGKRGVGKRKCEEGSGKREEESEKSGMGKVWTPSEFPTSFI